MRHSLYQLVGKSIYGQCECIISSGRATLNTIHIQPTHRHKGYGSILLQQAEHNLLCEHQASVLVTLVWQPQSDSTHTFYEKNGFASMKCEREQYYDDGDCVYELLPYFKLLNQNTVSDEYSRMNTAELPHLDVHITDYII